MTAVRHSHASDERAPLEGEIRDLVRRNVAQFRRPEPEPAAEPVSNHANELIRRVSVASVAEIDRVIGELNSVRDLLRVEGERVTREIAGFASLNHAAVTSMRVIADSLAEWKNGAQLRS